MNNNINVSLADSVLSKTLSRAVKASPDKIWLKTNSSNLTFSEVDKLSNRLANAFVELNVKKHDAVLAMMPDSTDFIVAWCALSKIGALEVPVNTAYNGQLLTHLINDSQAKIMICHADFLPRLIEVKSKLEHLTNIILVDSDKKIDLENDIGDAFQVTLFHDCYKASEADLMTDVGGEELISIVYTSGTTGPSKGVMTTQRHAYRYACTIIEALELNKQDVVYTCGMPLFHVAGKWGACYATLIMGATLAIPDKFSLSSFWQDVKDFRATTSLLPGVVASLLYSQPEHKNDANSTLVKGCMVPLIPEFEQFKARFGMRISMAYGSTECGAPMVHPMNIPVTDRRSVGRLKSDLYEVAIVDGQDKELSAGEIGEIVVRSNEPWIMMLGYWNRPEATRKAWRNLWFHSGDAGFKDEEGNYFFVDRINDCIRRRGENVSSSEVEGIIIGHPDILECAVYPVPSELTEDEIMVAIVLKPDTRLAAEELIEYLQGKMPYFMVPRFVQFTQDLPKTATGKVKKKELSDIGVVESTWDCVAAGIKIKR
ncbi:hypothetical protein A9Q81_15385 [Gammaproteobacteria bacterium 42_54_T18]|nr:hypothetical protein A9Q81_15385 [Gammaproteobacteria bacterium 42_54_T18]